MSQIRLYIDEDSSDLALVQSLLNHDIDVITALNANRLRRSDEEQLVWAFEQGRIIYSANTRDFYYLHTCFLTEGRNHAGIILVPQQRYSIGEQVRGILKLVTTKIAEDMQNQVEFLSAWVD